MKRLLGILCAGSLLLAGLPTSTAAQEMTIQDFVHQIYLEGIPYEEANAYDASVVDSLMAMLADSTEAPYWANIAITLCIIGDSSSVDPLLDFIKAGEGTLSDDVYRAKSSAVMALGYLINKTGDEKALNYLIESMDPGAWEQRQVGFTGPFQANTAARDVNLSTMAMLGLALSGRPEALEALGSVTAPEGVVDDPLAAAAAAARDAHQQIATDGLAEYYRKARENQ